MSLVQIIDCPRDAIQGIASFIPTQKKVAYIQAALNSGVLAAVDFGSFVSPAAVPQMADTAEVLEQLDLSSTSTELLAIVANLKGIHQAVTFPKISWLGYPFSVSETFQQRNARTTREASLDVVAEAVGIAAAQNKQVRVYISMGFGNPYGDDWSEELVSEYVGRLVEVGVTHFALSDTTGEATVQGIGSLYRALTSHFPEVNFSAHLHATPLDWLPKVEAAYEAGCRTFDGAMLGYGGCPFAQDQLVGNIPTEGLISRFAPDRVDLLPQFQSQFESLISHV